MHLLHTGQVRHGDLVKRREKKLGTIMTFKLGYNRPFYTPFMFLFSHGFFQIRS